MPEARVVLGAQKILVGKLIFRSDRRRSHSTFIYDQSWNHRPNSFDISPTMPHGEAPHYASSGGRDSQKRDVLAGPFSDSTPDSWGRKLMRRVIGEVATEFDFLVN